MERATRLARGTAVPRHAQRATNAPPGRFLASLAPCSTLCPLEPKNRRFCAVQAFCAAKPWRRANSLRPSILISCRNPKKEVTTYVVTSFFGAGDEARTRYLHLGKVALYQMSYARKWCLRPESNWRHADFQSAALPTELPRHIKPLLQPDDGDQEGVRTLDLRRDRPAF